MRPLKKSKTLYLVRHGALSEAYDGRYIGQNPVPLSDAGRAESAAVGMWLLEKSVDVCYAGTLQRVRETYAAAFEYAPQLPEPQWDARLDEIDFGEFSYKNYEEIVNAFPKESETWSMGNDGFVFPGGESIQTFRARVSAFLHDIAGSDAETVVVFSHGGVIMTLIAMIIGLPLSETFSIRVRRGAVAELTLWDGVKGQLNQIVAPFDYIKDK